MTFIDFFAGIGGFTAGLTQAGFQCIGYCEKDKHAIKSYKAIHMPNEKEWFCGDISRLEPWDIPCADGWTAGFPCQDISVGGKQAGISGKRSGLFFELIRLIKGKNPENRPRWILLENVKNLLSIGGGRDFTEILYQLSEAGYDCEWQLINSKSYVPQNRERVFIIGHLGGGCSRKIFPVGVTNTKTPIELIGGHQGSRVYAPTGMSVTLTAQGGGRGAKTGLYCVGMNRREGIKKSVDTADTLVMSNDSDFTQNQSHNAVFDYTGVDYCFIDLNKNSRITDIARCIKAKYNAGITNRKADNSGVFISPRAVLSPDRANKRQNGRRFKECGEPSFTLTCQDRMGVILCECEKCETIAKIKAAPSEKGSRPPARGPIAIRGRIRKLTPLECFRLQGFADEMFYKLREIQSDSQLYKQIGNSVTIPVIFEIGKKLMEVYNDNTRH